MGSGCPQRAGFRGDRLTRPDLRNLLKDARGARRFLRRLAETHPQCGVQCASTDGGRRESRPLAGWRATPGVTNRSGPAGRRVCLPSDAIHCQEPGAGQVSRSMPALDCHITAGGRTSDVDSFLKRFTRYADPVFHRDRPLKVHRAGMGRRRTRQGKPGASAAGQSGSELKAPGLRTCGSAWTIKREPGVNSCLNPEVQQENLDWWLTR